MKLANQKILWLLEGPCPTNLLGVITLVVKLSEHLESYISAFGPPQSWVVGTKHISYIQIGRDRTRDKIEKITRADSKSLARQKAFLVQKLTARCLHLDFFSVGLTIGRAFCEKKKRVFCFVFSLKYNLSGHWHGWTALPATL